MTVLANLLPELHGLSRADKIRTMSFLVNELAKDEDVLLAHGALYEIWSPYDTPQAAEALLAMLQDADRSSNE